MDHRVFIGYSRNPEQVSHEVRDAAEALKRIGIAKTVTWESTPAQGRLIITTVLQAIDASTICLFDITTLSENVLFEVGYAFSRQKHVLLCVNRGHEAGEHNWKSLNIFSTAGCLFYETGSELAQKFLTGLEVASQKTLWDDVSQALDNYGVQSLFYVPTYQSSESERNLRRFVDVERGKGTRVLVADPGEQGSAPLSWYVNAVYCSSATLLQMTGDKSHRSVVNNARTAFLAGLAKGLDRPLLIIVEDDYRGPVDYKDMLFVYHNKKRLKEHVQDWLDGAFFATRQKESILENAPRLELATELKQLRFGEYVAEDESDTLDDYFVRTAEYEAVLSSSSVVFVGRKGVGKSANMIQASQELGEDKRNLVCVIRPSTYELEGLVRVLQSIGVDGNQGLLIENFWKFLLYSEIAIAAVKSAERLPAGIGTGTSMSQLRDYLQQHEISDEFSVRLERAITDIRAKITAETFDLSIELQRARIIGVLHGHVVSNLRRLLGEALSDRARVALLVDNLDTAWRRTTQLGPLGALLLGLLASASRVADEFGKQNNRLSSVNVTLAIFLRSDIFDEVIKEAREPDKISTMRINWGQRDLLTRVIDERYLSVRPADTDPMELWTLFFCPDIKGQETRDYILGHILQRPRDFVFFCKAAVFNAVNARHKRVEESDILEAEKSYSKFALDALIVEYGSSLDYLEIVTYEFAGSVQIITRSQALEIISTALEVQQTDSRSTAEEILDDLVRISFLGVETREDKFAYPDRDADLRKAKVLSRKTALRAGREERFQIHPAYRNFLDVTEV
jgi:hypothetical protein